MAFLTPLYLLAGLAVGLPIFFHLIRQTPKGRQVFSSLMFLEPSPPKVTQRSRVEDWLLLILRALAVCLLAFAFARPFLRSQAQAALDGTEGKQVLILVDRSASMQREDLWEQAIDYVEKALKNIPAADSVSLRVFSDQSVSIISFSEWSSLEADSRETFLLEKLQEQSPHDAATNLGAAMMSAADLFTQNSDQQRTENRLIVISDFQTGSQWEELNGYSWSENIAVELLPVSVENSSNAAIQMIASDSVNDSTIRVRVTNSSQSEQEQFEIGWLDKFSKPDETTLSSDDSISVYVPPGQSRVAMAPSHNEEVAPQRLLLQGDEQIFNNTCFVAQRPPWKAKILFLGEEEQTGPDSLRFFLEPVFPETGSRTVEILGWTTEDEVPVEEEKISTIIIGNLLNEEQLNWSQKWLNDGGRGIFVARNVEHVADLYNILQIAPQSVQEADLPDYEMLRSVDLSHPVFSPFDDPRYADFSKLRFWKHRVIETSSFPEVNVLAKFESGSPAIFEIPIGKGRLVVFSAGWNRSDSDLAVWSKFVPMMNGFLEYLGKQQDYSPLHYVGGVLDLSQFRFESEQVVVRRPDGELTDIVSNASLRLNQKGIYTLAATEQKITGDDAIKIAVNLAPTESKTDPVSIDLLKAAGVPIQARSEKKPAGIQDVDSQRQLMNRELESQQKLWKWLLLAAIFVLLVETILAGIRQRNTRQIQVADS